MFEWDAGKDTVGWRAHLSIPFEIIRADGVTRTYTNKKPKKRRKNKKK